MPEFFRLLWGTLVLRPYVFAFLGVYLVAASVHLGWRRALLFVPLGYLVAFASEYCSIHWQFPYGDYHYIYDTVGRELWVAGVPFMDSLSYVFLAYCSYAAAIVLLSPVARAGFDLKVLETRKLRRSFRVLLLASVLMVFLDVIIDPVALQGYRWFLGQIYGYKYQGVYFGVPLSNFGGWLVVAVIMVSVLQVLDRIPRLDSAVPRRLRQLPLGAMLGVALYLGVLAFNLTVTFWIGERLLGVVGCFLVALPLLLSVLFTLYKLERLQVADLRRHLEDFPDSRVNRISQAVDNGN